MMTCRSCGSKNIKTVTNYTHGRKSRGITSAVCKDCGSSSIAKEEKRTFFRRRR